MIKKSAPLPPLSVPQKALPTFIGLSVAVLIISNIASVKITGIGPAVFDAGTILFPLAYIIGDIITEVYGYKTARMVVWIGFSCLLLMSVILLIVQYLPAGPGFDGQSAYNRILGFAPRIAAASLTAYLIGEFINITVLSRMKARNKGTHLWNRLIGSSTIGELLDTLIFSSLAFAGTMSGHDLLQLMLTVYLIKVGFDIVASPITIRVIRYVKQLEGIELIPSASSVPK